MEHQNTLKKGVPIEVLPDENSLAGWFEAVNASYACVEFDKKGNILTVNENFTYWMGYESDEIVGKHHRLFVESKQAKGPEYTQFWAELGKGVCQKGEFKHIAKNGNDIWLASSYMPITNDKGQVFRIIQLASNISYTKKVELEAQRLSEEVKAREEALQQNLEEMQATQEAIEQEMRKNKATLDGCVDAVITMNQQGIIEYFNPAAEKLWGYQSAEMVGKPLQQLAPATEMRAHHEGFDRYNRTGEKKVIGIGREVKIQTKSGQVIDVLLTLSEAKVGDELLFTAFMKDITRQKEQETQMQQLLNEAQNKEQYLNELLNVSNDSILTIDKDYKLVNFNKFFAATLEAMGIKAVKGFDIFEMFKAQDRATKKAWYDRVFAGESFSILDALEIEGSEKYYSVQHSPLRNAQGAIIGAAIFATDITEATVARRQSEKLLVEIQQQKEAILASEEELRQNLEEMQATQEEMLRKDIQITGQLNAINASFAYIEFDKHGNILTANDLFLQTMGFALEEIQGKHHRIFVDAEYAKSREYDNFWFQLGNGQSQKGDFKRIRKNGTEIWLYGSYTAVYDRSGAITKIIKLASDVTDQKLRNADYQGQTDAVSKSNAVIEFNMDGTIITANDNFLRCVGYSLDEIKGRHHRMLVEESLANSAEYKALWEKLNAGQFDSATYKRIGKNGKEIFIQATYNPIFDLNGKPFKVVKYATDITAFSVGFRACTQFIDEMKRGNLNAAMNLNGIRLDGEIAKVAKDLEDLRETINGIVTEVNRVVNLAGAEGQLRERLKLSGTEGAWKDLGDSLNQLLHNISAPILEINRIVTSMSMGDLTQTFSMHANGDLADMANALNIAIKNINKLVRGIEGNALSVASSSTQMLEKADSMKKSTVEVAAAITQMAEGAQEQALRTDESSKLVEDILRSSNEMGTKADIITKAAEKGQNSCNDGLRIIRAVVENMHEITKSADTTSNSIEVLTNRSEEISRTLNVITDIASQTNLLALNAAIEAARAGDAGRGFAVVAEEIRKLAEDSRRSAVEIERVVKDVQKDTAGATKAIDKMKNNVENGTKATKEAEAVFESINNSSIDTLQLSKQVLTATKEQQSSIAVVVKNIEKIVVVAEETASGTQEVASSSRELNKSMNEVSDTGRSLSEIATQLKSSISQFKLS